MSHTLENASKLITRVRRIKGQAEALERALQGEAECMAILQQIAAIRGAANGLMTEVLEGHLRHHLSNAELSQAERDHDLEAVLQVLRSYLK